MTRHRRNFPRDAAWAEAIGAYVDFYRRKGASEGSVELREYQLTRLSIEIAKPIDSVNIDDLERFLCSHAWGTSTQRAMRSALTTFFAWTERTQRTPHNPAADLAGFDTPPPNPKPVPEAEYERVVRECEPRLRMAIRLGGELGMRRAEVARVHRDHLTHDPDGWTLEVLGKGNKTRWLPLSDELAGALLAHIGTHGRDGLAFPSPTGGAMTPHWLGTLVSRALPDGFTMHKLRHRAATQIHRRSGGDLLLASELLGHSSVGTTQIYVAPNRTRLRELTGALRDGGMS